MKKILFGISALSFVLTLAPLASAQQTSSDNNDLVVIENLCDPDSLQEEFGEQWTLTELDFDEVEQIRIQLLERGFDPGFHPNRDNTIDAHLMEALAQFQAEYDLPVTAVPDAPTLVALSVRFPDTRS